MTYGGGCSIFRPRPGLEYLLPPAHRQICPWLPLGSILQETGLAHYCEGQGSLSVARLLIIVGEAVVFVALALRG